VQGGYSVLFAVMLQILLSITSACHGRACERHGVAPRPRAKRVTWVQGFLGAGHLSPYTGLIESSGTGLP